MLESRPFRAQAPIVDGLKRTFDASRISAASLNVIQSAADGIVQSPRSVEADEAVSVFALSSVDPLSELDPSVLSPLDDVDLLVVVVRRSFFAQPVPLKWMAGAANALRSVPSAPQFGQNAGPSSLMPWRMSVRCWHAEQMYS
jgi:hypothetical protein